jgi:hypothetical protein
MSTRLKRLRKKGNLVKVPKPPPTPLELTKFVTWQVLNSEPARYRTPAPKAKRQFTTGFVYTPDVLSFPRLEDLKLSTRNTRLFLVLFFCFGTSEWLDVPQWDFAERLVRETKVPKSFFERSVPPTPSELAAEESLLFATVLAWCLQHCPPGVAPDPGLRSKVLDYIAVATHYTTTYYRGKYFALSGLYSSVISRVKYRGKWSRSGRNRRRVRSPSAVGTGNSEPARAWRLTPRHLLLPKDGGKPDRESVTVDPLTLLETIDQSIQTLALERLNQGAFF